MRVVLVGVIAAGILAAPLAFGAEYRFTLVDYPGASMTGLTGINKYGQAPGNAFVGSDRIPFLYDAKTGSIVNLSIVPGEASTIVGGINNAAMTVGGTLLEDELTGVTTGTAYVRNADGSFNLFSHPDAVFRTEARAISDTGLITGYHDTVDGTTAFLYDAATGTFTDFAPSLATLSTGINAKGAVVGRVLFHVNDDPCDGVADQGSFVQYGFVRFPDGELTYFQVNGRPTRAGDIDNTGLIYGEVYAPDLSESRIFKTRVSREPCVALTIPRRDLRGKSSGVGYTVRGVNVRGTIAGFASDSNGAHGFVARELDQQ